MPCINGVCTKGSRKSKSSKGIKMAAPIPAQLVPQQPGQQLSQFGPQAPINEPKKSIGKKIGEFFTGSSPQHIVTTGYSPAQQEAFNTVLQMALSQLQNPYSGFEPIAEYARHGFFNETVPTLAERFTALGEGAQRSSAFPAALAAGGTELERSLAALRAQYGLQQQGLAQSLLGAGLTPQYQHGYFGGTTGFLQQALSASTSLGSAYLGGRFL